MVKNILVGVTTIIILSSFLLVGMFIGGLETDFFSGIEEKEEFTQEKKEYEPFLEHEKAVIDVVEENIPAVVSVVASRSVEYIDFSLSDFFLEPEVRERLEEEQGTGFIIREDGIILTNKHVVADEDAEYTVFLSTGEKFEAEVLARDPLQDLAVLKIEGEGFPVVTIGDSDTVSPGQTAIAIGNALGELENTVSVGVISGTGRSVVARGGQRAELLDDVLQTDAAINFGNSGGPLLNLRGEVIGVNTATMIFAEGIGFAIPINKAQRAIKGAVEDGEITYPFLGVRYLIIDRKLKEEENLPIDYGAIVVSGREGFPAVTPNSAADRAGIREGDIILEINGEKINTQNTLARVIIRYNPGDEVTLKILRDSQKIELDVVLGKME